MKNEQKVFILDVFVDDLTHATLDHLEWAVKKARAAEQEGTWKNFTTHVIDHSSCEYVIQLLGERLETDEEFRERIRFTDYQKEVRRQQYEKLKKEFGE